MLGFLRVLFIELKNLLLKFWLHTNIFVCARAEVETRPCDRQRRRVVCRTLHLVNIPIGVDVAKVAHACVCTHTLGLLVIPKREGIVVTIGKDDGVALVLHV